ncbi:MAG: HAMP domain-containing protein, partial [Deltaproteobacteria bacterium]|nr:HAMP domain-containing protein [Deltaproteobacteria bacterium]
MSGNKTIQLINDANGSNNPVKLRWVWLGAMPDTLHSPKIGSVKFARVKQGDIVSMKTDEKGKTGFRYTYIPLKLENHTASAIEIQQSLAPLIEYKHKIFVRLLIVGFLLLLISGIILYGFITYQIQRRLDRLSHKAKRIGAGDIEPDLEIRGNDELSDLAATMNDMCNRLLTAREKIST